MRMTRTLSVTRARIWGRPGARDEPRTFGGAVAHAPAAISRSRQRPLCSPLDAPARGKGLLGHGASARGNAWFSCHIQRRAFSRDAAGGVCEWHIRRALDL